MISILIPTIRPQNIPNLLATIEKTTNIPHEVIWEEDIKKVGCPVMMKMLVGKSKYDWIVFLGDDTLPEPHCIDIAYEKALKEDLWLVAFNDHDTERATHWLANKKLLNHLEDREFFYTKYIHSFCDDELRVRADKMAKYGWCYEARIQHNHPAFTGIPDSTYEKQRDVTNYERDRDLFWERNPEHKNYGA